MEAKQPEQIAKDDVAKLTAVLGPLFVAIDSTTGRVAVGGLSEHEVFVQLAVASHVGAQLGMRLDWLRQAPAPGLAVAREVPPLQVLR